MARLPTIHSVFIDEAGSVTESSISLLLALGARNMCLVGDAKQLAPFTRVHFDHHGDRTQHARSMLERAEQAGLPTRFLDTQYRMHPLICALISAMFYGNALVSHATIAFPYLASFASGMCWVDVASGEETHARGGFTNDNEVNACMDLVMRLHSEHPNARIFVLAMYKQQQIALNRRMHALLHKPPSQVTILTVDSAQGEEADFVILSLAKSVPNRFLRDRRRLCVALSRAKALCAIVGNYRGYRMDPDWSHVTSHCEKLAASSSYMS
jgi:superfamily I DNA and/or RNA helicase